MAGECGKEPRQKQLEILKTGLLQAALDFSMFFGQKLNHRHSEDSELLRLFSHNLRSLFFLLVRFWCSELILEGLLPLVLRDARITRP